ncbi:hypothetical protein XENOCAPTIV_020451 [Xenoophorus captivus]|uniref:Transposase n=1 Tax=Xenoophorus captivus TaxID=1517983 RepID=A0ABV0SAB4_9TELE
MLKQFNPGYTIPSRTHFAKLLEKKYQATLVQVKATLSAMNSKIALTADIWTSVASEAYLGITCHNIGSEWQMESICLSKIPLEDRQTYSTKHCNVETRNLFRNENLFLTYLGK